MKKFFVILFSTFFLSFLFSCTVNNVSEEFSFRDDLGNEIQLSSTDRVASAHASFADCWILAGGELVGITSDAVENHGVVQGKATIIGTAKTINREALVSSGATVVFLSADLTSHLEMRSFLEDVGIKYAYFKVDTFEDYADVMERFCSVTGREDLYLKNVTVPKERIDELKKNISAKESRTVLLMRAYSSGIKAKSDDNLAGLILKEYGLVNIADEHPSLLEDMGLEHIVSTDPDYIFVLTMGSEESALSYLRENIESNKAFMELKAIKNGNYYILPKELFHYKPNEKWDKSYEFIAKILYSEK